MVTAMAMTVSEARSHVAAMGLSGHAQWVSTVAELSPGADTAPQHTGESANARQPAPM